MKRSRFELEEAIMRAWSITEDVQLVAEDTDNLSMNPADADELQNRLMGIQYISDLKMKKVWDIFEALVRQGDLR
jgi:hypothetical protein